MKVAIIPVNFSQPIRFDDIDGELGTLQGLVGGDMQVIGLRPYAINLYLNENGKLEGLWTHVRATTLAHWASGIFHDDVIVGDTVVIGPYDNEGEDTGLSEVQVSWLRHFGAEELPGEEGQQQ